MAQKKGGRLNARDRRDKRRAQKIWLDCFRTDGVTMPDPREVIAAALKRERQETGFGAVNWFLFNTRGAKAKAKREIAQKYCTRKHCGRNCTKSRKGA